LTAVVRRVIRIEAANKDDVRVMTGGIHSPEWAREALAVDANRGTRVGDDARTLEL
jgi:hypothetical protein